MILHLVTPYVIGDGAKEPTDSLKNTSNNLLCWFASNQMKANPGKYNLIATCDNEKIICVNNYNIANRQFGKLLIVNINHKLNFNTHIDEAC